MEAVKMETEKKERQQYRFKRQFARPEIRIKKEDNENIKAFLKEKGYNSINDFINTLVYADMAHNFLPSKAEVMEKYPTADSLEE
jgi:uncharacterized protein (UPF0297 family)